MSVAFATDLCRAALQDIGAIDPNGAIDSDDEAISFERLNALLDQFAGDRYAIYESLRTTFNISQVASFAIGTGQVISRERPVFLDDVRYYDSSLTTPSELPLAKLSEEAYRGVWQKTMTGAIPASWYYNPTFPYGTLYLFPVVTSANLKGVVYAPLAIARFATPQTAFSLPPGYERFLRSNLAIELCGPFKTEPSPSLVKIAEESKDYVERANFRAYDLHVDPATTQDDRPAWSIYKGP